MMQENNEVNVLKPSVNPFPVEVTVEVTQEDIDKGCKFEATNCAIARAIKRIFPEAGYVGVAPIPIGDSRLWSAYVEIGIQRVHYAIDNDGVLLAMRFDDSDFSGRKAEPTTFTMKRAE